MATEALNIASQCRATASHDLACNIAVDGGSGLLRELLIDAARVIEALAQDEQGSSQEPEVVSKAKFNRLQDDYNDLFNRALQDAKHAKAWRAHVNNCQLQGVDLDHVFKPPLTAQPEQEPVAWWDAQLGVFDEKHFDQLQPLYTTPPKRPWVSLTDAAMFELSEFRNAHGYVPTSAKRLFVRIDAKLKELNT